MDWLKALSCKSFLIIFIVSFMALAGCKGSDTREEVDNTVEELAGKKKVDQMKKMEKTIGEIQNQQSERLDQLDNSDDG